MANVSPSAGGNGSQRVGSYAPTTTPTPGQPLLHKGKMLVYPNGWRGCSKCWDTGYKHGDPTHPCRGCWQSYGRAFNPLLASSAGLQGGNVLQKPLWTSPYSIQGSPPLPGRPSGGNAGYPGIGPSSLQPMNTGTSFQGSSMTGPYQPPPHPPIGFPPPPRRTGPPAVNRTEEAREDNDDEGGEAPPAYDDAVAAGPNGVLPPQRRDDQGRLTTTNTGISITNSNSSISSASSFSPPPHSPTLPGNYPSPPPHSSHTFQQHPPGGNAYGTVQHGYLPMQPSFHPPPAPMIPWGRGPPPGALVLAPGDPRIGGQLCYKCGGAGVRESLWFGDETCHRCGGSGRVF